MMTENRLVLALCAAAGLALAACGQARAQDDDQSDAGNQISSSPAPGAAPDAAPPSNPATPGLSFAVGSSLGLPAINNAIQQAGASLEVKGAYLAVKSGLCPTVALAWVTAENGVNNDILGVTRTGHLEAFPTWQQGIDAAVNLLRTSGDYKNIEAAIARGDCCQQRDANVASPWSGSSHYGHGADFPDVAGCPPY